LALTATR